MTTPLRVDGADISHHQAGRLDFAAFKKAGGLFIIHKATESTGFADERYAGRRAEVARAGLVFGSYHFARPAASSGTAQARAYLKVAQPKPGDLRPVLDLEDRGGKSLAALSAWTNAFVREVEHQTGHPPIIYTPFTLTGVGDCPLWVARYSNTNAAPKIPGPWKTAAIRQFSNGVYGVPKSAAGLGHVDLNTLPGGPGSLAALRLPTADDLTAAQAARLKAVEQRVAHMADFQLRSARRIEALFAASGVKVDRVGDQIDEIRAGL